MTVKDFAKKMDVSVDKILKLCKKLGINVSKETDILSEDDMILLELELKEDIYNGEYESLTNSGSGSGGDETGLIGGPNYIDVDVEVLGQSSGIVSDLIDSLDILFRSLNIEISVPLNTAWNLFLAKKIVFESIDKSKEMLAIIKTNKEKYADMDHNAALLFALYDGEFGEDGRFDKDSILSFINEHERIDEEFGQSILDYANQQNGMVDFNNLLESGEFIVKDEFGLETYDLEKINSWLIANGLSGMPQMQNFMSNASNYNEKLKEYKEDELDEFLNQSNLSKEEYDYLDAFFEDIGGYRQWLVSNQFIEAGYKKYNDSIIGLETDISVLTRKFIEINASNLSNPLFSFEIMAKTTDIGYYYVDSNGNKQFVYSMKEIPPSAMDDSVEAVTYYDIGYGTDTYKKLEKIDLDSNFFNKASKYNDFYDSLVEDVQKIGIKKSALGFDNKNIIDSYYTMLDNIASLNTDFHVSFKNNSIVNSVDFSENKVLSNESVTEISARVDEILDNRNIIMGDDGISVINVDSKNMMYLYMASANGLDNFSISSNFLVKNDGTKVKIVSKGNDIVAWDKISKVLSSNDVVIDGEKINITSGNNSLLIRDSKLWNDTVTNYNYLEALNYLYNTGSIEDVNDYVNLIMPRVDNRWVNIETAKDEYKADSDAVLSSVKSVGLGILEGLSTFTYALEHVISGEPVYRVRTYSHGDTMRSRVSTNIRESGNSVGAFFYDVSMSMADNAFTAVVTAPLGFVGFSGGVGLGLAMSSFDNSYNDALSRGIDSNTAFTYSISLAALEGATEQISFDNLIKVTGIEKIAKMMDVFKGTDIDENSLSNIIEASVMNKLKQWAISSGTEPDAFYNNLKKIYSVASQSASEGLEEYVSSSVGRMIDNLLQDKSNYSLRFDDLIREGKTEVEAIQTIVSENFNEDFISTLSGMVSGGAMAGPTSIIANSTQKGKYLNALELANYTRNYESAINQLLNWNGTPVEANVFSATSTIDALYTAGKIDIEMKEHLNGIVSEFNSKYSVNNIESSVNEHNFSQLELLGLMQSRLDSIGIDTTDKSLDDLKLEYSDIYQEILDNYNKFDDKNVVNNEEKHIESDAIISNIDVHGNDVTIDSISKLVSDNLESITLTDLGNNVRIEAEDFIVTIDKDTANNILEKYRDLDLNDSNVMTRLKNDFKSVSSDIILKGEVIDSKKDNVSDNVLGIDSKVNVVDGEVISEDANSQDKIILSGGIGLSGLSGISSGNGLSSISDGESNSSSNNNKDDSNDKNDEKARRDMIDRSLVLSNFASIIEEILSDDINSDLGVSLKTLLDYDDLGNIDEFDLKSYETSKIISFLENLSDNNIKSIVPALYSKGIINEIIAKIDDNKLLKNIFNQLSLEQAKNLFSNMSVKNIKYAINVAYSNVRPQTWEYLGLCKDLNIEVTSESIISFLNDPKNILLDLYNDVYAKIDFSNNENIEEFLQDLLYILNVLEISLESFLKIDSLSKLLNNSYFLENILVIYNNNNMINEILPLISDSMRIKILSSDIVSTNIKDLLRVDVSLDEFISSINNGEIKLSVNSFTLYNGKVVYVNSLLDLIKKSDMMNDLFEAIYNNENYLIEFNNMEYLYSVVELFKLIENSGYTLKFDLKNKFSLFYEFYRECLINSDSDIILSTLSKLVSNSTEYSAVIGEKLYFGNSKVGVSQHVVAELFSPSSLLNPKFVKLSNLLIDQVVSKFPDISRKLAKDFLQRIDGIGEDDTGGICNYADVANFIFEFFENKSALFEEKFGFPMYYDGELNDAQLLCDMFININNFIIKDKLSVSDKDKILFEDNKYVILKDDYTNLTGMYGSEVYKVDLISSYLKDKGIVKELSDVKQYRIFNNENGVNNNNLLINRYRQNNILYGIENALKSGSHVSLGLWWFDSWADNSACKFVPLTVYDTKTNKKIIIDGSHIMSVYGIDNGRIFLDNCGTSCYVLVNELFSSFDSLSKQVCFSIDCLHFGDNIINEFAINDNTLVIDNKEQFVEKYKNIKFNSDFDIKILHQDMLNLDLSLDDIFEVDSIRNRFSGSLFTELFDGMSTDDIVRVILDKRNSSFIFSNLYDMSFLSDIIFGCSFDEISSMFDLFDSERIAQLFSYIYMDADISNIISLIDDIEILSDVFSYLSPSMQLYLFKYISFDKVEYIAKRTFMDKMSTKYVYYKDVCGKLGIEINVDSLISFLTNEDDAFIKLFEDYFSKLDMKNDDNIKILQDFILESDISLSYIFNYEFMFNNLSSNEFVSKLLNGLESSQLGQIVSKLNFSNNNDINLFNRIIDNIDDNRLIEFMNYVEDSYKIISGIINYIDNNRLGSILSDFDLSMYNKKSIFSYLSYSRISSLVSNSLISIDGKNLGDFKFFDSYTGREFVSKDIFKILFNERKINDFLENIKNNKQFILDYSNEELFRSLSYCFKYFQDMGFYFNFSSPLIISYYKNICDNQSSLDYIKNLYNQIRNISSIHNIFPNDLIKIDALGRNSDSAYVISVNELLNLLKMGNETLIKISLKSKLKNYNNYRAAFNELYQGIKNNNITSDEITSKMFELLEKISNGYIDDKKKMFDEYNKKLNISKESYEQIIMNGRNYYYQQGIPEKISKFVIARIDKTLEQAPKIIKNSTMDIYLNNFRNPGDIYWEFVFDSKGFVSAASAGSGNMNIYLTDFLFDIPSKKTIYHEAGHNIDGVLDYISDSKEWNDAINMDKKHVSLYARKSTAEDFAESLSTYLLAPKIFAKIFPNRAKIISELLSENNSYDDKYTLYDGLTSVRFDGGSINAASRSRLNLFDILSLANNGKYDIKMLKYELIEKLSSKVEGMTQKFMYHILNNIESYVISDSKYSMISEYIFNKYKDNSKKFEYDFGFPMYIEGELNKSMLAADIYLYMLGSHYEERSINELFSILVSSRGKLDVIEKLVSNYLIDRRVIDKKQEFIYNSIFNSSTDFVDISNVNSIVSNVVSKISDSLKNGKKIVLSLNSSEFMYDNGLVLKDVNGEMVTILQSGDSVTIIDVLSDNKIVVENSIGRYYIDIKNVLINGKKFNINEIELGSVKLENRNIQRLNNNQVSVDNKKLTIDEFNKGFNDKDFNLGGFIIKGYEILDFINDKRYIDKLLNPSVNNIVYADYSASDMIYCLVKLFQELDNNGFAANKLYPYIGKIYNEYKVNSRKGLLSNDSDIRRFASNYVAKIMYVSTSKNNSSSVNVGMNKLRDDGNIDFEITDDFYSDNIILTEEATMKLDDLMNTSGSFENTLRILKNAIDKKEFDSIPDVIKQKLGGLSYNQMKTYLKNKIFDIMKDDIEIFDLSDFFYKKNDFAQVGAYVVITGNDMIMVPSKHGSFNYSLGDIFEYLDRGFDSSKYKNENMLIKDSNYIIVKLQNIESGNSNIIYSSDIISSNQYRMLQEFNEMIKEIALKDNLFKAGFILSNRGNSKNGLVNTNNIDGILSKLVSRVISSERNEIIDEIIKQQEVIDDDTGFSWIEDEDFGIEDDSIEDGDISYITYPSAIDDDFSVEELQIEEDEKYYAVEDKLYERYPDGVVKTNALGTTTNNIDVYSVNINTLLNVVRYHYDEFMSGKFKLYGINYNVYRSAINQLYEYLVSGEVDISNISLDILNRLKDISESYIIDRSRMINEVNDAVGVLKTVEYDKVILDNGFECIYEKDKDIKSIIKKINLIFDRIPDKLKNATKKIILNSSNNNPGDAYWGFIYATSGFKTAASSGGGAESIILYKDMISKMGSSDNLELFVERKIYHEIAHNFDEAMGLISSSEEWNNAIKKDGDYPSNYARNGSREDFAESVVDYLINKEKFIQKFSNRAKILEQVFSNDVGVKVNNKDNINLSNDKAFVYSLKYKLNSLINYLRNDIKFSEDRIETDNYRVIDGFVTFSKDFDISLKQMGEYFGDAGINNLEFGKKVNRLFLECKTVNDIMNELNLEERVLFLKFLDTDHGQYLSKLNSDEIKSLIVYTGNGYNKVNMALQGGKLDGKVLYRNPVTGVKEMISIETIVENIDSAIKKAGGVKEDSVYYRGVSGNIFLNQNNILSEAFRLIQNRRDVNEVFGVLRNFVGYSFEYSGYVSASPGYNTSYAKRPGFPIVLEILTPEGTNGIYINQISKKYNVENEFLFDRNVSFKILDVQLLDNMGDINGSDKVVIRCVAESKISDKFFVKQNVSIDDVINTTPSMMEVEDSGLEYYDDTVFYEDDVIESVVESDNVSGSENKLSLSFINYLTEIEKEEISKYYGKELSDLTIAEYSRYQFIVNTVNKILENVSKDYFKSEDDKRQFLFGVDDCSESVGYTADELRGKFNHVRKNDGDLLNLILENATDINGIDVEILKVYGLYNLIYAMDQFVEKSGIKIENGELPIKKIAAKNPDYYEGAYDEILSVLDSHLKSAEANNGDITKVLVEIASLANGSVKGYVLNSDEPIKHSLKTLDSAIRKVYNDWCSQLENKGYSLEIIDNNIDRKYILRGNKKHNIDQLFILTDDGYVKTLDGKEFGKDESGKIVKISFSDYIPNDLLRYTIISDIDNYVGTFYDTLAMLESRGYEVMNCNLSWPGSFYRGINLIFKDNKTSQIFELQFHTEESFYAKDDGTHLFYEVKRNKAYNDGDKKSSIQKVADYAQILVQSQVDVPVNAEKIGFIKDFVKLVLKNGKGINLDKMSEIIQTINSLNGDYKQGTDEYKNVMKEYIDSISIDDKFSLSRFLSKYFEIDCISISDI